MALGFDQPLIRAKNRQKSEEIANFDGRTILRPQRCGRGQVPSVVLSASAVSAVIDQQSRVFKSGK